MDKLITAQIENELDKMKIRNDKLRSGLKDKVVLTDYSSCDGVWTKAFQQAVNEHEIVIIPAKEEPYLLDGTVVIPSNRYVFAEDGAVIRLKEGTKTLMLRNEHPVDGTHYVVKETSRDENITIEGGLWEEWCLERMGYGQTGMIDEDRSYYGVTTCFFFDNVNNFTLKNLTFRRCGGFALQIGEAKDIVCENIRFEECFADGLHINGNVENVYAKNVKGQVGDDLVALNMFDWQRSSVNFGPCKNVLCEDLELSKDSPYKAIRIQPGIYTFKDGTEIDCSLTNAVFRRVRGIKTFKMYCQTPRFTKGSDPEKAGVGSGDNIIFEDVVIDLDEPIDLLGGYIENDPVTGSFAGFELGSNIDNLYLKDIKMNVDKQKHPYAYLLCIGPKSVRRGDVEIFDPYFSSVVKNVYIQNVVINGKQVDDLAPFVREIEFNALYDDMPSTAKGEIEKIIFNK